LKWGGHLACRAGRLAREYERIADTVAGKMPANEQARRLSHYN
jgi:hypothetical protein